MRKKVSMAEREIRRQKVAANLLAGLNYRAMAEAMGVSIGTIAGDVKVILNRWQKEQVGVVDQVMQIELTRLDRALNAIWANVLAGDDKAINNLLKIMERRAKLLGMDKISGMTEDEPFVVKVLRGVSMDDL